MILDIHLVVIPKNSDHHRLTGIVLGVVNSSNTRDYPYEVLLGQVFPHQLGHHPKPTDLDLNTPILNVVFHGCNQHRSSGGVYRGTDDACTFRWEWAHIGESKSGIGFPVTRSMSHLSKDAHQWSEACSFLCDTNLIEFDLVKGLQVNKNRTYGGGDRHNR